jgi:hypothetical protein
MTARDVTPVHGTVEDGDMRRRNLLSAAYDALMT